MNNIKRLVRNLTSVSKNQKYWFGYYMEHKKIDKNTVLFECFHGRSMEGNPLILVQEMAKDYPERFIYYCTTRDKEKHNRRISENGFEITMVHIASRKYVRLLATAGYIISNASLPNFYIRREEQVYLQTWHGVPLKSLGKSMRHGVESMSNVQHNFLQASHIMFPNDYTRGIIMRDYGLEQLYGGKVIMSGYPSNHIFLDKEAGEALKRQLGLENKRVYAYMPTWRGSSNQNIDVDNYINELKNILKVLDRGMKCDQRLFINFHPIFGGEIDYSDYEHIMSFPPDVHTYAFLNSADALITDYSSVMFDFSLTEKPVILFTYDYDRYIEERGMYLDIKELPFIRISDVCELAEHIAQDSLMVENYTESELYKNLYKYDTKDGAERVIKLLVEGDASAADEIDCSSNLDKRIKAHIPNRQPLASDLDKIAGIASDENDVVVLYKKWFGRGLSEALYDNYRYAFNYVITVKETPRTYLQQVKCKIGSKRARNDIAAKELNRMLPGFDVEIEDMHL